MGHPLAVPRQCSTCDHCGFDPLTFTGYGENLHCERDMDHWKPVEPSGVCQEYMRAIGAEGDLCAGR
jgi:hypothetical protein